VAIELIVDMAPLAAAWILFSGLLYFFWMTKGWTAIDRPGRLESILACVYFPFVSSVVSAFSLQDAMGFLNSRHVAAVGPVDALLVYAFLSPLCVLLIVFIVRYARGEQRTAALFVTTSLLAHSAFFTMMYLKGALYFGDRYFVPVSLMLLPFLISVRPRILPVPLLVGILPFALALVSYGILSNVHHVLSIGAVPLGGEGFRQPSASRELLDFIHSKYDHPAGARADRVVYVPSPEITIEIRNARIISTVADFEPVQMLRQRQYFGKVSELVLLMPNKFETNGKADAILRSFVDYAPDRWRRTEIGERFVAFVQSMSGDHLPEGLSGGNSPRTHVFPEEPAGP
jgi:hypothetical protein